MAPFFFFPPPPPAAEAPAMSGFQFPGFYQLPPFFTLQPNAAVRTKQLELWKQLASEYCKAQRSGADDETPWGEKAKRLKKPKKSKMELALGSGNMDRSLRKPRSEKI